MPGPRVVLLVNPAAGRGRAAAVAARVADLLQDGGLVVEVLRPVGRAVAERAVASAVDAGPAAVLALGGDGTAHAALQAVAGTGTPLGVLPAGSGNDLALALGVPADPVDAARAVLADLRAGTSRRLDAGRADGSDGDRWWATVLCCGFDSAVADRAARLRWPRGRRRYDVAVLAELARLRPRPLRITVDGVVVATDVTLVAVGNTGCYGGGLRICPAADPADGLLDVTVVGPVTRRDLVRTRPRLARGEHLTHPAVRTHRARSVVLADPRPGVGGLTAWADGEPVAGLPVTLTAVPGALTVLGTGRR